LLSMFHSCSSLSTSKEQRRDKGGWNAHFVARKMRVNEISQLPAG
jgi:hypothetical protein